jgi:hypothetical protein
MRKTNDIKSDIYSLIEMLEAPEEVNEETGEVVDNTLVLQELLDEVNADKADKADDICYLIREAKTDEEYIASEIKRLQARKKMFENKQDSLKELLNYLLGGEKLKTAKNTISYRNTSSVTIVDESLIPAEFIKVKEVFSVDKKAIGAKLKEFEVVDGAELTVKKTISIR